MERGVHPGTWTYANIEAMKAQFMKLGLSLDWSREFATCDPEYYGAEQALFLKMLDKGLVYRKASKVNWDPVDNTVLANEQVIDGRGWRSGALVEQRELTQWFFRITAYADDLLEQVQKLDRWPEKVRVMQANWIGRSEGLQMKFRFAGTAPEGFGDGIDVFTTRPDTLFGASFVALSPDHPIAVQMAAGSKELQEFRAKCAQIGTSEEAIEKADKLGFDTGLKVAHPFIEGATVPVWIANFVLMGYGTGAIFGCPAHDQRDLDFARKFALSVTPVVLPPDAEAASFRIADKAYTGPGSILNSGFLDGLAVDEAKRLATARIEEMGQGQGTVNYRLRDWGVSRQLLGFRSRSCIAKCAALFRCRKTIACAPAGRCQLRQARQSAGTSPNGSTRRARLAASRRGAKLIRSTHSSTAPGISRASLRSVIRQSAATGCRWTSISAASNMPCCTFSIPASSPARCATAA